MDGGSIERLELRNGERVTAAHVNQLDRTIARNASLPGFRVLRRQYPWGTHSNYYGEDGEGDSPIFRPDVLAGRDFCEVRWSGPRALIAGIAPTIGEPPDDVEIFTEDEKTGQRPMLKVTRDSFDALGECRIFFKVTTRPDFLAQRVTPVALAAKPAIEPYTAYKLALFLRLRNGAMSYQEDEDREMFCGQGFLAVQQRPSGRFEPLFWAKF